MKIHLHGGQCRLLERLARRDRDTEVRQRYLTVLALAKKMTPTEIEQTLGCARSTVYRVGKRFMEEGEHGLRNRRKEVPPVKVTEEYMSRLKELVCPSPKKFKWQRST